jgi:hypothetical protein
VDFDAVDQLLIRYSVFVRYWRKMEVHWDCTSAIYRLQTKPVIQLGGKYYTTLLVNLVKLVRLIKMCLNETYGEVYIDKHLSDAFPIQNGMKQGMLYHCCFLSSL